MAIFMKFGDITGDVETSGFEKWTELQSFQWGVGRGVGSAMSGGNSREGSIPSVSEITVTKRMDGSSPGLWTDALRACRSSRADLLELGSLLAQSRLGAATVGSLRSTVSKAAAAAAAAFSAGLTGVPPTTQP